MIRLQTLLLATSAVLFGFAGLGISRAQHFDVLVQQVDSQLATGTADFDSGQWYMGRRVYSREFDGDFAVNNPGYNALGAGSPSLRAGSQALPGNTALAWDFLPMTIETARSNLYYWNGLESDGLPGITPGDVLFGMLPGPGYTLGLFDKTSTAFTVNGSPVLVPGGVIDDTAGDGSLHRHRFYQLLDNDGNGSTLPADGIYLFAMQLRMAGLATSKPIYMVFGTLGSSVAALDAAAVPWVEQQLNLPGDYSRNGVVDAADYTLWRDTLNQTGAGLPADGSGNQLVDQADYDLWRMHFGEAAELIVGAGAAQGASVGAIGVPEPCALVIAAMALVTAARWRVPRRR
jgi:hypothetical protein